MGWAQPRWSGAPDGAPDGAISGPASTRSTLGVLVGGTTTPAGTARPATRGTCIPLPGGDQVNWVMISGTAAQLGDTVLVTYEGRLVASPNSPAARIVAGAGPGAVGPTVIPAGSILLSLSGTNTDGARLTWVVVK